jgi:hypothetical protein
MGVSNQHGTQALLFSLQREEDPHVFSGSGEVIHTHTMGAQPEYPTLQPLGTITFDGVYYRYTGFVLDVSMTDGQVRYIRRSCVCTPDEIGVNSSCEPDRVRAMCDTVGANRERQLEIQLFGKRVWHSPWRPEHSWEQGLDWALGHEVELVARLAPLIEPLFRKNPALADTWIQELRRAYLVRRSEPERLHRVLLRASIPPEGIDALF